MTLMERLRRDYGHGDGIADWMRVNARDREFAAWCRYVLEVPIRPEEMPELQRILVPLIDDMAHLAQPAGLTRDEKLTLAIKKYEARKKKKERP